MKIVFIGSCGHAGQAYAAVKDRSDVSVSGVAAGSDDEIIPDEFLCSITRYDDYREMLDNLKPDYAVVSPIFGYTGRISIECAKRGINVFSEKPVAKDVDELEVLEEAVKDRGIRFSAMHYLRFDPAFYHGANLARSGIIGKIKMVNAQKSYKFGRRPGWYADRSKYTGTIPWIGIHALDWIYAFTGKKFKGVNAMAIGNPEMSVLCQYVMEDDILASVNLDYYRPQGAPTHGDDYVRCVGEDGIIEVRYGKITLIKNGVEEIIPGSAPELFTEFIDGREPIPFEEVFYLTRIALVSRDAQRLFSQASRGL